MLYIIYNNYVLDDNNYRVYNYAGVCFRNTDAYIYAYMRIYTFVYFTKTNTIERGHTGIESMCTYHIYIYLFIYIHFYIDLYVYNHIDASFGVSLGVYILQNSRQPFNRLIASSNRRSTDLGYGYKLSSGMKVRRTLKFRKCSTRVHLFKNTGNTFSLDYARILRGT